MFKWIKNLFVKDIRPKCPNCKKIFNYLTIKPILGTHSELKFDIVGCTACSGYKK
jgi:transposase-like protein